MAVAHTTLTVKGTYDTWVAGDKFSAIGTVAVSASPDTYSPGGIPFPLSSGTAIKSSKKPDYVSISGSSGYAYIYVYGTSASTGKLMIMQGGAAVSSPAAELGAVAIPATVSADTIHIMMIFPGMR